MRHLLLLIFAHQFLRIQSCSSSIGGQSLLGSRRSQNGGSSLKDPCGSNKYTACKKADLVNGRRSANKISFGLYQGISHAEEKKSNLFFLPLEIGSIISLVVDGSEKDPSERAEKASSLIDMRCHIRDLKKSLNKNVLVDTSFSNNFHRAVLMLVQRRMFADMSLKVDMKYARDAFCWYDIPINRIDFNDAPQSRDEINDWGREEASRASKYITNLTSTMKQMSMNHNIIPDDSQILQESKILIASSTILKLAWMKKLFCVKDTAHNEPFHTDRNAEDGSERVVRVSFMKTSGSFPFVETGSYQAVSLPLDTSIHKGRVLFIMPKKNTEFTKIESSLITQYDSYLQVLQAMSLINSTSRTIQVHIPIMNLRIPQEFAIPSNQHMLSVKDPKGNAIPGNKIHVFQDTYLEMIESTADCLQLPSVDDDSILRFDHPFLMFVEIRDDLIAFGRIKDPLECTGCGKQKKGMEEEEEDGKKKEKMKEKSGSDESDEEVYIDVESK